MNHLPFALPDITAAEIDSVAGCLRAGWLTSGPAVQRFEAQFARAIGAEHAVACSSATMASLLIFDALGVGPGDEVTFPAWTFSGPPMMAHRLGATVVLADVDRRTFNLSSEHLGEITSRTRAVVPTHFAGLAVDVDELVELADPFGVAVVDDAAHAFPARDADGRTVGAQAAVATFFSFYATKPLTTGDGGMVVTNDAVLADKVRRLRTHGMSREAYGRYNDPEAKWRYEIVAGGWKANMTDFAAAIGLAQLRRATGLRLERKRIADAYCEGLRGAGVTLPPYACGHAWHLFPILVEHDRDGFIDRMAAQGVQCSVHFIPLHKHPFWQAAARIPRPLVNCDWLAEREVSLPIFSKMTDADVERVIAAVKAAL
jgi:dTDP-4-amino-4,6-dideoxygalactose transaminase